MQMRDEIATVKGVRWYWPVGGAARDRGVVKEGAATEAHGKSWSLCLPVAIDKEISLKKINTATLKLGLCFILLLWSGWSHTRR